MKQALTLPISEHESRNIAANLSYLLRARRLTVNQVAVDLGIPVMTVRRLVSGETTDPRISTLKMMADYFDVTVDSLVAGDSQAVMNNAKQTKPHFVPIITWEVAEQIESIDDLNLTNWQTWQPISLCTDSTIGKNAFALESRPSMYPRFPNETVFVIDPDIKPTDGDMVLVRIKHGNKLTLRELSIDPPEWVLQPIISGSNALLYSTQAHAIVGVNLLTMLYNRRIYS